jgi:hypothetical protein
MIRASSHAHEAEQQNGLYVLPSYDSGVADAAGSQCMRRWGRVQRFLALGGLTFTHAYPHALSYSDTYSHTDAGESFACVG